MGVAAVQVVPRGCGMRKAGGVYIEVGTASGIGKPLEGFLCDPPVPMTTDCKVGVELIERGGVVHIRRLGRRGELSERGGFSRGRQGAGLFAADL